MSREGTGDIFDRIRGILSDNPVVLFMKGNPSIPRCGFSSFVSSLLAKCGVDFKYIDVLESNDLREGVKIFSNWPTIPQLYVKSEFVGGYDIVREMHSTGELAALFSRHKIPFQEEVSSSSSS